MSVRDSGTRPHKVWCILQKIKRCLQDDAPYKVSCNNDRCWEDIDVNKFSCAVNINLTNESFNEKRPGGTKKHFKKGSPFASTSPFEGDGCSYINSLSFRITIYSLNCDDESLDAALRCMAMVQERACACTGFRDFEPESTQFDTSSEGAEELTLITMNYSLEYTHSACDPTNKECQKDEL